MCDIYEDNGRRRRRSELIASIGLGCVELENVEASVVRASWVIYKNASKLQNVVRTVPGIMLGRCVATWREERLSDI